MSEPRKHTESDDGTMRGPIRWSDSVRQTLLLRAESAPVAWVAGEEISGNAAFVGEASEVEFLDASSVLKAGATAGQREFFPTDSMLSRSSLPFSRPGKMPAAANGALRRRRHAPMARPGIDALETARRDTPAFDALGKPANERSSSARAANFLKIAMLFAAAAGFAAIMIRLSVP